MLLVAGGSQTGAADSPPSRHRRPPAIPMVRPQSLLSPAERAAAPLSREWLVGYWVYAGSTSGRWTMDRDQTCRTDGETAILPDGSYRIADGFGRWTLEGARIVMSLTEPPNIQYMQLRLGDGGVSRIRKLAPDEIGIRWRGAPEVRFIRCD